MTMQTVEFIEKEFKMLAKSEIEHAFESEQANVLSKFINSLRFDPDFSNIDKIKAKVQEDKKLSSLVTINWLLEQMNKLQNFNVTCEDIKLIEKKILAEPKNKIMPFLWICFNLELIDNYNKRIP